MSPLVLLGLIPYLLCLWLLDPIVKVRNLRRGRRLVASHATYRVEDNEALNRGKLGWRYLLFAGQTVLVGEHGLVRFYVNRANR